MSEQTVKEIRAKFTADLSGYRKQVQEATAISRDLQERIAAVGQAMSQAQNITGREMQRISQSLASAGKQAAQLGKQAQSLAADESQLTRAVAQQQGSLNRLETEYNQLQERNQALRETFDTVQSAISGLNLSGTLAQELDAAQSVVDRYDAQIQQLKNNLTEAVSGGYQMVWLDGTFVELDKAVQKLHEMEDAANQAGDRLVALVTAEEQVGQANLGYASTAGLKQLQEEIGKNISRMEQLSMQAGQTSDRLLTYQERLDQVKARQQETATATANLTEQVKGMESAASSLGSKALSTAKGGIARLGSALGSLGGKVGSTALSGLKSVANRITGIGSSAKSAADGGLSSMVKQIRNIGVVSLGLKVCSSLFGRLRSVINNCVSSNDSLSTQVDVLQNSLNNALAPAISVVINLLNRLMPYIVGIADAAASLITSLFGSGWTTVSTNASGAADAIEDATDAQEAYNRTVAGFDQITKLNDSSSSSSSGSSGSSTSTDTTDSIAGKTLSWLEDLGAALADMWDVCKDAWDNVGAGVMDSVEAAYNAVKGVVEDVGETIYNVWTDGTGQAFVESLLEWFGSLGDVVAAFADSFDDAWNHAGQGESVISSLFDSATDVFNMTTSIGEAFADVWSNGTGMSVWSNILNIVTDVNDIVGNLASGFTAAWEEGGRGEGIMQAILDPINTILGYIEEATSATAEWADNLDFEPILGAAQGVLEAIDPIVDTIGDVLETVWENVILPLGDWLMTIGLPDILSGVQQFLEHIGDSLATMWDYVILPLFNWLEDTGVFQAVYDIFMAIWDAVGLVYTTILSAAGAVQDFIRDLSSGFQSLVDGAGNVFQDLCAVFQSLVDGTFDEVGVDILMGILNGIVDGLASIGSWIYDHILSPIVNGIKSVFGIASPATNEELLSTAAYIGEGILNGIASAFTNIGAWVQEHILTPIVNAFNTAKDTVIEFTVGVANTASDWWGDVKKWWGNVAGKAGEFATDVADNAKTWWSNTKSYWSNKVGTVSKFATDVKDSSKTWWSNTKSYWSNKVGTVTKFATDVADSSKTWWSNTKSYWSDKVGTVAKFATDVKDGAKTWWSNTKSYWSNKVGTVTKFATDVKDSSKTWWSNTKSYWSNKVGTVSKFATDVKDSSKTWWTNTKAYWNNKVGTVSKFATDVKDSSKTWWSNTKSYWSKKVGAVSNFTTSVTDSSKKWWTNVTNWWGKASKDGASFTVSVKNTAADLWKKFKEGWSGKTLGLKITYSTNVGSIKKAVYKALGLDGWPTISFAARGGIVDRATLFGNTVVGEAGTEAIIPLENHTEWLDMVADRLKEAGQNSAAGQPVNITVYVGGEKLVSQVVDGVNAITTQTGTCPIYV